MLKAQGQFASVLCLKLHGTDSRIRKNTRTGEYIVGRTPRRAPPWVFEFPTQGHPRQPSAGIT